MTENTKTEPVEPVEPTETEEGAPPQEAPPQEEYRDLRAEKMAKLSNGYDRESEVVAQGGQPQKTVEHPNNAPEPEVAPEPAPEPVGDPPVETPPVEEPVATIKVDGEEKQLTLAELQAEAQRKIAADQAFRAAADQKRQNEEREAELAAREQAILQREAELAQAPQVPLPSDAGPAPADAVNLARRALLDEDPIAVAQYNELLTHRPPTTAPAVMQVDEDAIVRRAQEAAERTVAEQQWQADLTRGNTEVYADTANAEFLNLPGAVDAVNQAFNDLTTVEPGMKADYYVKKSAELVRTDFETKLGRKFGADQPLPAMEQRRQSAQQHAAAVVSTSQSARAVGGEQVRMTTDQQREKMRANRVGRSSA